MEVILSQLIRLKNASDGWQTLNKSFESDIIPHKGDFIEDSVWKADDEQEVQSVIINYQQNYCYVQLSPVTLDTEDNKYLDEYVDMAKSHGWVTPSELIAQK